MANLSSTMTLHIELSGLDRDLLERVCENLEWYRKHLQEQAQVKQEREALKQLDIGLTSLRNIQDTHEAKEHIV